jgi:transglutaminase-like putative cysteine protease
VGFGFAGVDGNRVIVADGGFTLSAMSESDGSGGAEYGEVALALAAIAALVVAAALLPGAGLGSGMGGGERGTPAAAGTPDATAAPGGGERPGGATGGQLPGGSPSGVPLSEPPERTRIGSTQGFEGRLPQTPQFVVEGPENAYWRQTAYATYTGSSWASSPGWRSIDEGVPNDARTVDGRAMDYRVTLLVPSSSLPTAWQPSGVELPNASASAGVEASTVGGVRATTRLPAGTDYLARSSAPPSDPSTLRAAGTDYPDRIEERYTQLPEATPDRVGTFTDDLTAGDETPYDEAVTIRDWLRQKPYSLNASHEAGEPVADQFIFEMESGYCQYYATSMVAMLRTQGIPARYVVGYAPGERVGENQYLVTSDRGHAWVEAFFPGTGWVRFDPTGSGRLPVRNPQPPYDISLNRSAVAGAPVSISVAKNGTPVVGAPVELDGERVGWTDAEGTVTTRLPYTANLTVTARPPDATTKYDDGATETAADRWADGPILPARGGASIYADRAASPTRPQRAAPAPNGSSRTYRSDTNVTLSVEGTPVAGGGTTVRATIRDVPVRGATVTLDGERVGTTGPDGRLGVSLADVSPGTYRLAARREAVDTTTTIRVYAADTTPTPAAPPPVTLSVSTPLLPLPGGPAAVTTTRNGTPVEGARVTVGGATAGTTAANGTLDVSLPVAGSTTVVARAPDGASARTTLPLARNAAVVGGVALGVLAVLGRAARRRGLAPRSAGRAAATWLSRLVAWATAACIRAADRLVAVGRALRRELSRLAALPERLATRGLAALSALDPRVFVGWFRRWLVGLLARGGSSSGDSTRSGLRAARAVADDDGASTATIRDLWREFVALVAPPRVTTRTPGEIARYAIDRGLPAEPIDALTEAYRDAEYGRLAPDADRLDRARAALRAVRETLGGESG